MRWLGTGLAVAAAAALVACAATPLPAEPVGRADHAAVQRQLAAYITQEMSAHSIAGLSIALVEDQQVVWATGFGHADLSTHAPAGPQTLYRMGSISKLLTVTAAMQQVAQGRLSLDAPVQDVLPAFRIGSAWPPGSITLRGLMTHRAGLPRDMLGGMWLSGAPEPQRDFRAVLRSLGDEQLRAPPGLMFSYSNLGMDLVGLMVEAAAGEPFEDHVRRSVLQPLGMRDAIFSAAQPAVPNMARGHFKAVPQTEPALRDVPAGALTASVDDMARLLMMQFADGRNLAGQPVLPQAQQAEMLRVQNAGSPLDADMRVGLGWMLTTFGTDTVRGGGPVAHHGGATLYHRSQLMMLPEHKLGVVVAANDGAAGDVVNRVAQRALALLLEARTGHSQKPASPGFVAAPAPWTAEERLAWQRACAGDYITVAGLLSMRPAGEGMAARLGQRRIELREGVQGRFGVRYRWLGLLPVPLGNLSLMGFQCQREGARELLFATLDGERLMVGERLAPASSPGFARAWLGRYEARWQPDEVPTLGKTVRLVEADGRLWVEFGLHPAFGGGAMRALLQPESEVTARLVGPLADTGSVLRLLSRPGERPRVRYSGWEFERVAD